MKEYETNEMHPINWKCKLNKPLQLLRRNSLFGGHHKLFHNNKVLYDKNTVILENILSEENRVRVQSTLQKYEMPTIRKVTVSEDHKKVAVLVPLCTVNGEPSLLFMVRSNLIPAHRGVIRQVKKFLLNQSN